MNMAWGLLWMAWRLLMTPTVNVCHLLNSSLLWLLSSAYKHTKCNVHVHTSAPVPMTATPQRTTVGTPQTADWPCVPNSPEWRATAGSREWEEKRGAEWRLGSQYPGKLPPHWGAAGWDGHSLSQSLESAPTAWRIKNQDRHIWHLTMWMFKTIILFHFCSELLVQYCSSEEPVFLVWNKLKASKELALS